LRCHPERPSARRGGREGVEGSAVAYSTPDGHTTRGTASNEITSRFYSRHNPCLFRDTLMKVIEAPVLEYKKLTAA
jgi:hypothetical protein